MSSRRARDSIGRSAAIDASWTDLRPARQQVFRLDK
jgi:hypothetical protein